MTSRVSNALPADHRRGRFFLSFAYLIRAVSNPYIPVLYLYLFFYLFWF